MNKLKFMLSIALILNFLSCNKENVDTQEVSISNYPSEITIDNWEQFIYAPQSIIDKLGKKELEETKKRKSVSRNQSSCNNSSISIIRGWVKYFKNNNWEFLPNTEVRFMVTFVNEFGFRFFQDFYDISSINTYTDNTSPYNLCTNNLIGSSLVDFLCWYHLGKNYNYPIGEWLNGLSTFDMLLIQRHILAITPFTTLREYIAADIDRSGAITINDVLNIRRLIVGDINSLPTTQGNHQPFVYVNDYDYDYYNNNLQSFNGPSSLTGSSYGLPDCGISYDTSGDHHEYYTYAIKRGDVNGTASY